MHICLGTLCLSMLKLSDYVVSVRETKYINFSFHRTIEEAFRFTAAFPDRGVKYSEFEGEGGGRASAGDNIYLAKSASVNVHRVLIIVCLLTMVMAVGAARVFHRVMRRCRAYFTALRENTLSS